MFNPANQARFDLANSLVATAINQLKSGVEAQFVINTLNQALTTFDSIDQKFAAGSAEVDIADAVGYLDGTLSDDGNPDVAYALELLEVEAGGAFTAYFV